MQFTIVAIAAFAAAVSALPQINGEAGVRNSGVDSCSKGTAASCCDTSAASDGLLSNILGGSCALNNIQVPVLAVGAIGGAQCNQGNSFCCPTSEDVRLLSIMPSIHSNFH